MITTIGQVAVFLAVTVQPASRPATRPAAGMLGATTTPVDDTCIKTMVHQKMPRPPFRGLFVVRVVYNSPAAKAGIRPGDLLWTGHKGRVVLNPMAYSAWLASLRVGRAVPITIYRVKSGRRASSWRKFSTVKVCPVNAAELRRTILRHSYIKLDGKWVKLPSMDIGEKSDPWLPKYAVGSCGKFDTRYGTLRAFQNRGRGDVIARIDRLATPNDPLIRLVGFSVNVADGQTIRLAEPLAIVSTWSYGTVIGVTKTILLAVPLACLRSGLTDSGLVDLEKHLRAGKRGKRL